MATGHGLSKRHQEAIRSTHQTHTGVASRRARTGHRCGTRDDRPSSAGRPRTQLISVHRLHHVFTLLRGTVIRSNPARIAFNHNINPTRQLEPTPPDVLNVSLSNRGLLLLIHPSIRVAAATEKQQQKITQKATVVCSACYGLAPKQG